MTEESPFSSEEAAVLTFVTLVSALLSLVAVLVIALSYVAFSALRTYPFRLVMYLLGANLGSTLAYIMGGGAGRWTDVYEAPSGLCTLSVVWDPLVC